MQLQPSFQGLQISLAISLSRHPRGTCPGRLDDLDARETPSSHARSGRRRSLAGKSIRDRCDEAKTKNESDWSHGWVL